MKNQIDLCAITQRYRKNCAHRRGLVSVDGGSDHHLVRAKIQCKRIYGSSSLFYKTIRKGRDHIVRILNHLAT
ncbi:hypothetical protein LSAT2_028900 [Lamellibrachia satsuma]|nr:hypothetical protein LSAT2_028900 [Lamellibrachia satsuma]